MKIKEKKELYALKNKEYIKARKRFRYRIKKVLLKDKIDIIFTLG